MLFDTAYTQSNDQVNTFLSMITTTVNVRVNALEYIPCICGGRSDDFKVCG